MGQALDPSYAHCEQLVREADKDLWLAALFGPADRRPHLYALQAFSLEIAGVKQRITQPLAGELRLQWWRDVLEGQARGEVAGNPVAAALRETIDRYGLPHEPLIEAIEAHRIALYGEAVPDVAALEDYFDATIGGFIRLQVELLTDRPAPRSEMARHAAAALGIGALIRDLPRQASDGFAQVPDDILARHGAGQHNNRVESLTAAIPAALADLRQLTRTHLVALRGRRGEIEDRAAPAYLPVSLVEPLLRKSEAPGADPFDGVAPLPQWRRQWILWRAAGRKGVL